jgi:hypothetical protein
MPTYRELFLKDVLRHKKQVPPLRMAQAAELNPEKHETRRSIDDIVYIIFYLYLFVKKY